ncbi:diacylglycerol kinase [Lacticaseibacillus jixianensis]|uniref:Diacylglycerol kinase n=1 Tax=Lacticaseibacillus jixianensis TaxID=2486012 RepID=A0ABW4B9K3_9LACO|nr:diacylglycerol kinase [Lacticaseibacillus jixianensis]
MFYWILVFAGFLVVLALSQWAIAGLKARHININRWIWALSSFLVMIIPYLIWPHLNDVVAAILYGFCALFAVIFMIEEHSYFLKKGHM